MKNLIGRVWFDHHLKIKVYSIYKMYIRSLKMCIPETIYDSVLNPNVLLVSLGTYRSRKRVLKYLKQLF